MTPFLYKIAEAFFTHYGNEIYKLTFVFPNRRAGVFFQKYLADIAGKAIFSPRIITIQELFESLSQYRIADKIELLILLFQQYTNIGKFNESLDDFLYWGEMLLNDFSDADKHMVDTEQLFKNINNLRSINDEFSYLSVEQIEAIRQFWENFNPNERNETKQSFLEIWQILPELYSSFRESLQLKGLAYEGMLFRDVADKAKRNEEIELPLSKIVFVGLNALTPAEITLMQYLKKRGIADFYWDYESSLLHDKKNRASSWIVENLNHFSSEFKLRNEIIETEKRKIKLIGVPSGVGQAKVVNQLLSQLINEKQISGPNTGLNTAIVLPEENLLLPTLYSIPEEIEKVNVTMGYSLQNSSVASLIAAIASLQNNTRVTDGKTAVYYKFALSILNHPLVRAVIGDKADNLKAYIQKYNRVLITTDELGNDPFLLLIFTTLTTWKELSEYLKSVLSEIFRHLTKDKQEEKSNANDTRAIDIEREFIVQYYKSITRLQETLGNVNEMTIDTYFRLLRQLSQSISVSFSGEPLSGLQVMGILETRVLDFENLIILSMNEGIFPLKKAANSFIPYSLRRAFGLPVYEHQDSTYAYHFYRMISRAKRIYMLYDTRTEEMQTGEVSRYFYQLKYLYANHFKIEENVVSLDVSSPEIKPVTIYKTEEIMQKLQRFTSGGDSFFSASSVNTYINCPLQFYFSSVENLSEEKEVQESVESDVFGTIYHAVMQQVYDRFKGKVVLPDTLNTIIKDEKFLTELIEDAFAVHYFRQKEKKITLVGHQYLIGEILRDYVKQTLTIDKQFTPFEYVASEYRFKNFHPVTEKISVNIKGSIDRIDKTGDMIRIIDYKSGKGKLSFSSIDDLFDVTKKERPYQIFQVFFYALFYNRSDIPVSPAIYYLRSIFEESFNPGIHFDKHPINDISFLLPEFKERLNQLFEEIFDKDIPFSQTQNEDNCKWCAFKQVCGR